MPADGSHLNPAVGIDPRPQVEIGVASTTRNRPAEETVAADDVGASAQARERVIDAPKEEGPKVGAAAWG
jgi:hypothetical protein